MRVLYRLTKKIFKTKWFNLLFKSKIAIILAVLIKFNSSRRKHNTTKHKRDNIIIFKIKLNHITYKTSSSRSYWIWRQIRICPKIHRLREPKIKKALRLIRMRCWLTWRRVNKQMRNTKTLRMVVNQNSNPNLYCPRGVNLKKIMTRGLPWRIQKIWPKVSVEEAPQISTMVSEVREGGQRKNTRSFSKGWDCSGRIGVESKNS